MTPWYYTHGAQPSMRNLMWLITGVILIILVVWFVVLPILNVAPAAASVGARFA